MKPSSVPLRALSLALLLCLAPGARGDLIPWTFNWSRSPEEVYSDNGQSKVILSDEKINTVIGNSYVVGTNLQTVSGASPTSPDVFTARPYSLTLNLTDLDSLAGGSMTFNGLLDGTVSSNSSLLSNSFTGDTTQQMILGNHLYTVTIGPFTPPGPPSSALFGSISALAIVKVSGIPTPVETVPEPGTLTLAALGAAALAGGYRRRRRRPSRRRRAAA